MEGMISTWLIFSSLKLRLSLHLRPLEKKPLTVKFTDNSTGSPTSWSWNFGDKSISASKNPVHKYTKAGKYTVSLTVKNAASNNTVKKPNYITVK